MIVKVCEFCEKEIEVKRATQRFCSPLCQGRHYRERPGIREKFRVWTREYRKIHPEIKEKNRILAVTRYRERRRKYWKEYGKRPEVRSRINEKDRMRRKIDEKYAIIDRLRRSLNHALTKYSKTGKIMSSRKYGIDWEKVINSLEPFPEKLEKFEIDHIIPLHTFNLTEIGEIKKAFDPLNLQWLTIEENRKKSGKIIDNEDNIKSLGGNRKSLISA